ncbi:MAG: hypothetical protein HWQ43_00030 [Nostoc sp. JL31]|uniref:hypothetical protein n=1 Tax=Nostoc sp. JL31 TaxID=2815395 RepID=UPI0025D0E6E6|nr:hypothetical protein [Nostoc sp. JL31]MBN3887617.1 hypothetical protein [Nostoc sp. JL31]
MSTASLPLLESKLCGASRKPCGVTLRAHPLVEKRSHNAYDGLRLRNIAIYSQNPSNFLHGVENMFLHICFLSR